MRGQDVGGPGGADGKKDAGGRVAPGVRLVLKGSLLTALAAGACALALYASLICASLLAPAGDAAGWWWDPRVAIFWQGPTLLDSAATLVAAIAVSLVPSSRLRLLPVLVGCGVVVGLRVSLASWFLSAFEFGPGARSTPWLTTVGQLASTPVGLLMLAVFAAAVASAALRPDPRTRAQC